MDRRARRGISLALAVSVVAGCGSSPPAGAGASPLPRNDVEASSHAAGARGSCLSRQALTALRCPEGPPPLASLPARRAWPTAADVVTTIRPPPMATPASSEELDAMVGRAAALAKLDGKGRDLLVKADKAFDGAARAPAKKQAAEWEAAKIGYKDFLAAAPVSDLSPYARYRLAHALWNLGERALALDAILSLVDSSKGAAKGTELAALARRDAVILVAETRPPADVPGLAARVVAPGEDANAVAYRIGERYAALGRFDEAVSLYDVMLRASAPAKRCAWQAAITRAKIIRYTANPVPLDKALAEQIAAYRDAGGARSDAACGQATAAMLTEAAVAWHVQAVGADGVEGTRENRILKLAADGYRRVVDNFQARELDGLLRAERLGTLGAEELGWGLASLAEFRKDWRACASAYAAVGEAASGAAAKMHAALAGYECEDHLFEELHYGKKLFEIAPQRPAPAPDPVARAVVSNATRYLCGVAQPPPEDAAGTRHRSAIRRGRARALAGAHDLDAAAVELRDIAFHTLGSEEGHLAAVDYLEALESLSAERAACKVELETDRAALVDLYCPGHPSAAACANIAGVGVAGAPAPRPWVDQIGGAIHVTRPRAPILCSTSVSGGVVPETTYRVVALNAGRLQSCLEAALRRDPAYAGGDVVTLTFAIGRDGSVSAPSATSTRADDGALTACMTQALSAMFFPQPEGGVQRVTYPVALGRTGIERLTPTQRADAPVAQ